MTEFGLYLQLGFNHIADIHAYDHILFVVTLCLSHPVQEWKKLLILITAFTIGHSVTLALSVLKIVLIPADWVEFCIPITIILSALINLRTSEPIHTGRKIPANYLITLVFGLIHGLGFSNYLRALLGKEVSIVQPLLAFNLGLEAGQILIIAIVSGILFLLLKLFRFSYPAIRTFLSGAVAGIALTLLKLPEIS
ncbi:MAG: HupE/UreJ family protein [Bacteroidia bacterium]|nr:HupE/UreJ family protein [Bacteroidia bacterium]